MMITLRFIINRARDILKTEGLASVLRRGFLFLIRPFFDYYTVYLYETTLENFQTLNETDFKPKINNFTIMIVSTNREADRLEAEGLEFRSSTRYSRQLLDKGAEAWCVFVGRELANINWLIMTKQAKDTLRSKTKVDFSNNEVCSGLAWTNPKYRRMGFQRYTGFKRGQFAFSQGKTVIRSDISKSNIASLSATGKVYSKYGEARYLKILWWKSWKETPLS